jgi:N-acetylglucosamine-6-sulfatase
MKKALSFIICLVLLIPAMGAAQSSRPNIVVIMIDDEDVASLRLMVDKGLMPNLKTHLLDVGYEFVDAFTIGTYGATSRAGFLTGQYPHNHKEIGSDPLLGAPIKFNDRSTVAVWLQNAGYRTGLAGRYITGYGVHSSPAYVPPGWSFWAALKEYEGWATDKYLISINGTVVDFGALAEQYNTELYQTDILAWIGGEFIRSNPADQPFFLWLTPVAFNREIWPGPSIYSVCPDPASSWYAYFGGDAWGISQRPPRRYMDTLFGDYLNFPLPRTPSFNEEDVSDKPAWVQMTPQIAQQNIECLQKRYWRRLEVMRAADDLVGYVMDTLAATQALSNTVVIFTGDSGLLDGQHRHPDKGSAYEEVIRTPLVIRTRESSGPQRISGIALTTDLAPTVAEIAGVTPAHVVDGRSLVPIMANPSLPWRKQALLEHGTPAWTAGSGEMGFYSPPHFFALRIAVPARTFVSYPTVSSGINGEYYRLETDPFQLTNLFADPSAQTEIGGITPWLNAMKTCRGAWCRWLEDNFNK